MCVDLEILNGTKRGDQMLTVGAENLEEADQLGDGTVLQHDLV